MDIKIRETESGQAVSARELHLILETEDHFTQWCKRMFEYGFIEGADYQAVHEIVKASNGFGSTKRTDYALTIECAKEISMLQRTEKGKEARKYFIKCEKRLRSLAPKTFAEALQLAADQAKMIEIKVKQLTIEKDKRILQQMLTEVEWDRIDRNDIIPRWRG